MRAAADVEDILKLGARRLISDAQFDRRVFLLQRDEVGCIWATHFRKRMTRSVLVLHEAMMR
jgi:hypothetical protein